MGKASEPLWAEHRGHGTPVCLAGPSRSQVRAKDKQGECGWPQASHHKHLAISKARMPQNGNLRASCQFGSKLSPPCWERWGGFYREALV